MGKKERRAALVRVTKKLSALRSTLKKDERELLDRIVLGAAEVAGHAVTAEVFSKRELPSKRESPARVDLPAKIEYDAKKKTYVVAD